MRNAAVPAFNSRQAAFVDHVLTGCSATVAAQRAGYSERSARQIATRLLSKAAIRAEIQARQGVDSQRLQLERQDVIAGLLEAIAQARERRDPAAMIAGWKTIGTMLGMFAPQRHQVEVSAATDNDLMRKMNSMSDAELSALLAPEAAA